MSSYFDTAARTHAGLPSLEAKLAFTRKVVDRVKAYLDYIEAHSPKSHQQAVHDLRQRFAKLSVRAAWDEDGGMLIQNMHTLGHEIGTARVPLIRRSYAHFGDNPYYAGRYEQEEA